MFENVSFVDPNYNVKQKYNKHYKALKNFVKKHQPFTEEELKLISKFFERNKCAEWSEYIQRRTLIHNIMGSLRVMFYTAPFHFVEEDIKKINFNLPIDYKHKKMIEGEYIRKSKNNKHDMGFKKESRNQKQDYKVEVVVKKRPKTYFPK